MPTLNERLRKRIEGPDPEDVVEEMLKRKLREAYVLEVEIPMLRRLLARMREREPEPKERQPEGEG